MATKKSTEEEEVVEELDEYLYPALRVSVFSVLERALPTDLPEHYRNLSEVIKAGQYRVVGWEVTTSSDTGGNAIRTFLILLARDA